jgi:hypothetical protein
MKLKINDNCYHPCENLESNETDIYLDKVVKECLEKKNFFIIR